MTDFSVVMPIHNEEHFLPYSLPSIYGLVPDDVILLFDRCSDNSLKVAYEIATRYKMLLVTRFIEVSRDSDFRLRFAFLRWLGCELASFDLVLVSAADLVLDSKIKNYVTQIGEYGLITFEHVEYPVNWRQLIKRLLARFLPFGWLGGVRLLDRRLLKFEDVEELKGLESGEDTHLAEALRGHCKTLYVMSDTVHLRPREDKESHLLRGRLYARFKRSFWLAFACGLVTVRLSLIKGYITERAKIHTK